jgi:hypothetical protein
VVNPFTKYALTITPVAHSLEELLPQRPDSAEYRSWSLVIRTALVLSTIAVAVLVPFFGNPLHPLLFFEWFFPASFPSLSISVAEANGHPLNISGASLIRCPHLGVWWKLIHGYLFCCTGLVMAFIGAFLSMTVSVILPCACYLSILDKKATLFQVILCSAIIVIGIICLIGGTYSSVAGIIDKLSN